MTACGLCGAAGAERRFLKADAEYFRCRDCGFEFSRQGGNPNFQGTLEEYEASYLQYLEEQASDLVNHRRLLAWMGGVGEGLKGGVLDVGCGGGKFVRFLRSQGVEATGLEASQVLFERYLAKEPFFTCGTLETLAAAGPVSYPTVTLFDVLEHVEAPRELFRALHGIMPPGGRLFLSTPDVGSLLARVLGPRWHFYNKYHLSYFSPRTLERLCRDTGFKVLDLGHHGKRFPVGYLLRYARDFLWGRQDAGRGSPSALDALSVPLNTFDIMYVALERA